MTSPDSGATPGPEDELVEVVDDDGLVTGTVSRSEMRTQNLRHRCTFVAVIRSSGHLVVHKRAAWKDVWPSRWDICFGGVVGVGEGWDDAARRELAEEAGITSADLELLGLVSYADDQTSADGRAYLVVNDDDITSPDGEVAEVDDVPLAELASWMSGRDVTPDSAAVVAPLLASWLVDFSDAD